MKPKYLLSVAFLGAMMLASSLITIPSSTAYDNSGNGTKLTLTLGNGDEGNKIDLYAYRTVNSLSSQPGTKTGDITAGTLYTFWFDVYHVKTDGDEYRIRPRVRWKSPTVI